MKTLILIFVGCAVFSLLPPDLFSGDPAKMLMPFIGLFMAGIFPAISLTISSLKSGGFSVKRVRELASQLRTLLNYLQAVFLSALISALALVSGEILRWGDNFWKTEYTSRVFNIILGGSLTFLILALPRIRAIFRSLLRISEEIAVDEASTKINDRAAKLPSIIDRFPTKEKFGELFEVRSDPTKME